MYHDCSVKLPQLISLSHRNILAYLKVIKTGLHSVVEYLFNDIVRERMRRPAVGSGVLYVARANYANTVVVAVGGTHDNEKHS